MRARWTLSNFENFAWKCKYQMINLAFLLFDQKPSRSQANGQDSRTLRKASGAIWYFQEIKRAPRRKPPEPSQCQRRPSHLSGQKTSAWVSLCSLLKSKARCRKPCSTWTDPSSSSPFVRPAPIPWRLLAPPPPPPGIRTARKSVIHSPRRWPSWRPGQWLGAEQTWCCRTYTGLSSRVGQSDTDGAGGREVGKGAAQEPDWNQRDGGYSTGPPPFPGKGWEGGGCACSRSLLLSWERAEAAVETGAGRKRNARARGPYAPARALCWATRRRRRLLPEISDFQTPADPRKSRPTARDSGSSQFRSRGFR